jgi:hypothetical protein
MDNWRDDGSSITEDTVFTIVKVAVDEYDYRAYSPEAIFLFALSDYMLIPHNCEPFTVCEALDIL